MAKIKVAQPYNKNLWAAQLSRMGVGPNAMLSSSKSRTGSSGGSSGKVAGNPSGKPTYPSWSYNTPSPKSGSRSKPLTKPTGKQKEVSWSYNDDIINFAQGGLVLSRQQLDEYSLGGWIKDNKQGVIGGLKTAAGIGAMAIPGLQGVGMGLIGGGLGDISGEIQGDRQEQMMEDQQAFQTEQQAAQLKSLGQNQKTGGSYTVANQYAPTFSVGGEVESQLVELEGGEPFRSPDGTIGVTKTSAPSHKEGGVPISLEVGTEILGKEKDSDTGMKFKELGAKLARRKRKFDKILEDNKGMYARNAAKAMNKKLDDQFTTLFQKQEALKGLSKGEISKIQNTLRNAQEPYAKGGQIPQAAWGMQVGNMLNSATGGADMYGGQIPEVNVYGQGSQPNYSGYQLPQAYGPGIGDMGGAFGGQSNGAGLMAQGVGNAGPGGPTQGQGGLGYGNAGPVSGPSGASAASGIGSWNWGNIANTAAQLAPVAYNLIQGSRPAEHLKAQDYYNPEYNRSIQGQQRGMDLLANRKYDIEPELEANATSRAISDYNVKTQGGLSAGAIASNRLGNLGANMRQNQSAYATKQRFDNQYRGEQAAGEDRFSQLRGGLGANRAATNFNVANINQQADAARRGMLGKGFEQLSDRSQMQQLMNNQQTSDQQRIQIMQQMYPYFQKWFGDVNFGTKQG